MSDVQPAASRGEEETPAPGPAKALERFIDLAKGSPALKGITWGDVEWVMDADDAVAKEIRTHRTYRPTLCFTNRETSSAGMARRAVEQRVPLHPFYIDFAKSDLRMAAEARTVTIGVLRRRLSAHQFLEAELRQTAARSEVLLVTLRHFQLAEEAMAKQLGSATAYRVSQALEQIGRVINGRHLCGGTINYVSSLKRPRGHDILTDEGQTEGLGKMVSAEALDALAKISVSPADAQERLFIRIVDLLLCGGFRIGEVLTLPKDCWIEEPAPPGSSEDAGTPRTRCGIQYFAEKARDYRVKWLPLQAVELAKRAVDDLTRLGEPMRAVAAWMSKHPARLKAFEGLEPDDFIEGGEACKLLGLARHAWKPWKIFRRRANGRVQLRVRDIEELYLARWKDGIVLTSSSGKTQMLSETLIVAWENQFHGNRATLQWMPRMVTATSFSDRVSPAPSRDAAGLTGLLTRFGVRVTSHEFRHWLNTIAANEGLSDIHLAKWMGRIDLAQNQVYKHGTLAARTAAARRLIMDGGAYGPVARIAATLPLAERDAYLAAAVETAHATDYGLCLHNFASAPCPNHLQCLRRCGDYLRVKGDTEQRDALLRLKEIEIINRDRAQLALTGGYHGAGAWLENSNELLEGIDEALAVDDMPTIEGGAEARVFPDKSKLKLIK